MVIKCRVLLPISQYHIAMTHAIYKITNLISGKIYIGQTINFNKRWLEHKSGSKKPKLLVHQAMKTYGIENFTYELIDECTTQEDANNKEQYYIASFNSISPNGYNVEAGGNYAPLSQEALLKISKALKGRTSPNKGVPCSEEQKAKISATLMGKKHSDQRRKNISLAHIGQIAWNKGKNKLTDEQRLSIKIDDRPVKVIAEEYDVNIYDIQDKK